ncbi:MAG: HupE/UreJ family protein [Burkholderiales bacterium]|nr:HupE/UreJ family protein [Burkholderiales bacterium]
MTRRSIVIAVWLLASVLGNAWAHEVRPGYLELRQTGAESWSVLWKVPARGEMRLSIHPRFPSNCRTTAEPIILHTADAHVERTSVDCKGGLEGREISIDGLAATMTDVLARSVRADGSVQLARLTPSAPAFVFAAVAGSLQVARAYTAMGVEHIVGGVDHLLFVLGLLLLVRGTWLLVKTITAFTVAHSITLAAATLGWVHVPQPPVEAVIALSILFLASELAKQRHGRAGLMERYPWIVAFTFGLLHGFGFASALRQIGLPQSDIPLALLTFNVGVEIGQLAFIAVVLVLFTLTKRIDPTASLERYARPAAPYAIGTLGSFWFLERLAGFWS